ncbi:MAG: hypothetical protein A3B10_00085 [Candidatus Doudnabacteria bacterium RIFCSPLOWO2_01_FULL_44_21]|uniref:Uncharacterized protein n=1 Tax=Candidatus Doudnabacteria bacterium RIFCSPLOWO2_01_FULL_44_21 TaxID=1817841 RepID=A0A1F5PXG8_9BACT|nr:MAG: hypothetical protein A3B95_03540 [Candidatus Doudnabacteria bacterium RIFCSPHIGHO2_02_FULL_43_13b]OGE94547.1 MAG: hypothetical protein A3B10_00085 [Candidatus Doudnabacteria bacterium RIFCSPLOWO2_01_FULL_44_21]
MTPAFQPTNLISSIVSLIFYLIMAGFVLYSLIALYALLRYGRSKILAIVVSLVYLTITAGLYVAAVNNLSNIKF